MQNAAKAGPARLAGNGASDDAKPYTQDQIATLLGFHGAMNVAYLTKIWRLFKSAKVPNYDYLRRTIKGEMIRWADGQRCWIKEGVYFDNKTLDEWIALKFNPQFPRQVGEAGSIPGSLRLLPGQRGWRGLTSPAWRPVGSPNPVGTSRWRR